MADHAHQSGWYPDPWKQAELRWHDGTDWTGQVHGNAAPPAATEAPAPTPTASPIKLHGEDRPTTLSQPVTTLAAAPQLPSLVPTSAPSGTSGKATASLVTALIGVPFVPIILGILALRDIGRSAGALGGRGLAIAGIVLGSLGFVWIAILLAVAVPTFLAQKDAALGTQAQANAAALVNAVETCAVSNLDGTYGSCAGADASAKTPEVAPLLARCNQPGGGCITPIGTLGYEVSTSSLGDGPSTTYRERHGEDGTITKTCSGPACPSGTW